MRRLTWRQMVLFVRAAERHRVREMEHMMALALAAALPRI